MHGRPLGGAAAVAALAVLGSFRDLERFTLPEMLARSDGAVVGRIEERRVREVDVGDGAPMYFTTLRIEGTDLATGEERSVEVLFAGGFVDETRGRFSSTAPPADHTRVGREVLAFHESRSDLPGGLVGEVLVGARSGLFTTFRSRRGAVIVQGRGRGVAIRSNVELSDLRERVKEILERDERPR